MLLARAGYRVLLVDRAAFPSDTMSTHAIHPPGVSGLERWGLLDRVVASGCPPFRRITLDFGPFALSGCPPPVDGIGEHYAPRRRALDAILVDAAVEAGAELRERFAVSELVFEDGRVTGVRSRSTGGRTVVEHGRVVVGADGLHSSVASALDAPRYNVKPTLTCAYYSYWSGLPLSEAFLYIRPERTVIAFPTNDELTVVIAFWPHGEFHAVRKDIEASFARAVESAAPALAGPMRDGSREERFVGTAELPNMFRKPHGPGWALVGDAGYHKDPLGAHGIMDAFRDAELLATAIDEGLSGRARLEEALAGYEQARNAAAVDLYELNCQFASLQPPPRDMRQLLEGLSGDEAETNRFIGAFFGTVPVSEFFSGRR
jgi:2-polyprenyl-6-methoxyphenol hydroxylase-like FAD-dependent oxidoreductase